MKYTVVWRPSAERMLAELWTSAPHRDAVTRAANQIDADLRIDPLAVGESRSKNTRVLCVSPLGVYYDVLTEDRLVVVWAVWRFGRETD